MPLFELFRLAKGKLDPSQENEKPTSCPADSTTLPENDFAELTWDNGQFAMQDQCVSRDRKSLPLNSTDSLTPEIFRFSGEDNAKAGKIGNHQGWSHSGLLPPGSSAETDLSQEDDMVPWLHYPISGSSNSDYCSDFLPELPEVTVSEIPVQDNFGSVVKPAQGLPYRGAVFSSLQNGNGLEEGTRTRTSNTQLFSSSSFPPQPQTPFASSQTQLRRADSGPCSNTSSSVVNFSYFARPAAILRSNSESSNRMAGLQLPGVEGLENRDTNAALDITNSINQNPVVSSGVPGKRLVPCGQTAVLQHRVGLRKPEGESSKVPVCARKDDPVILKGDLKEDKFSYESWRLSGTKGGSGDGEKILEPVGGSSSVCSGNSVERASNDLQHGLKRKSQETEESEDHSDDIEDELVSTKKQATTQDSPSRRNRAAEVHNLSERRRRDRINEKMRALQELVPNCNKVDKASMLDEVIEYVKTLKLQLQMMTMAGLYMTPMMLSTRMQHMGQVPHFPNMGMGMGMGMGMPHMNMQGGHIPGPFIPNMPAMAGPMYGIHGQGLHLPMPRVPLVPFSAGLVLNSAIGPNNPCGVPASVKNQDPATLPSVKESAISQQPVINTSSGFLKQQPRSQSVAAPSSGQAMNRESGGGVADSASRKDPSLKTGNRHTLGKFMDNGTSMEH